MGVELPHSSRQSETYAEKTVIASQLFFDHSYFSGSKLLNRELKAFFLFSMEEMYMYNSQILINVVST